MGLVGVSRNTTGIRPHRRNDFLNHVIVHAADDRRGGKCRIWQHFRAQGADIAVSLAHGDNVITTLRKVHKRIRDRRHTTGDRSIYNIVAAAEMRHLLFNMLPHPVVVPRISSCVPDSCDNR